MTTKKQDKKSIGSSVASDVRDNELTEETMPPSVSSPKKEEPK